MYVGIDLGTTKCAAAIAVESTTGLIVRNVPIYQAQDIEHDSRNYWAPQADLPSVLYVTESGCVVVGIAAQQHAALEPERVISSAKLWLGQDITFQITPEKKFTPIQFTKQLVVPILDSIQRHTSEIASCVLTVPSSFDLIQKQATLEAAKQAGVPMSDNMLLDEPTAAFLSIYGDDTSEVSKELQGRENITCMVIDIGGGTSDISVIRLIKEEDTLVPQVLATSQRSECAGDDFDEQIARELALRYVWSMSDFDYRRLQSEEQSQLAGLLIQTARQIKEQLSRQMEENVSDGSTSQNFYFHLNQKLLQIRMSMNYQELDQSLSLFLKADSPVSIQSQLRMILAGSELKSRGIDKPDVILLTGQMAHLWLIKDTVRKVLPDVKLLSVPDPRYAVARGAAIQAATRIVRQQYLSSDLLLRTHNGFYPLVLRGMSLPIAETTIHDALRVPMNNCRGMSLQVWEGSEERYDELRILADEWIAFPISQPRNKRIGLKLSMSSNYELELTPLLGDTKLTSVSVSSRY